MKEAGLKSFLFENLYRSKAVDGAARKAEELVSELFRRLYERPEQLPEGWRSNLDPTDGFETARRVTDYIAGMTDRFAEAELDRLFDAER